MHVVIVGGGGFALEILSYIQDMEEAKSLQKVEAITIVDHGEPLKDKLRRMFNEINFVDHLEDLDNPASKLFVIGLGNPQARKRIFDQIKAIGGTFLSVIHPKSNVDKTAQLGEGVIISPFAHVAPFGQVLNQGVLNIYASVGHEAILGEFSVLSPYATLNGNVRVGEQCFLASASVISPGFALASHSKLSAGSVLNQNTEEGSLAHGNPAKHRVMFRVK